MTLPPSTALPQPSSDTLTISSQPGQVGSGNNSSPDFTEEKKSDRDSVEPEQSQQHALERDNGWDENPANPLNWSLVRKWKNVAIVSLYTFISPLASSMMAPGLPEIAVHYEIINPTVIALTLSIYLLAFALGPLVAGPLSEMYGRTWVLHTSNLFFMAFTFGCIFAPNSTSLIVFRFLAGLGGGTPVAIGPGSISDLFIPTERGTAMSIYTLGPLLGPVLGPIAGGFLVQSVGFKWVFVLLTILAGIGSLVGILFMEETYAPVIKENIFRKEAADSETNEKNSNISLPPKSSLAQSLRLNLSRPFMLLTRSLICFMLSLYMALVYGYLYLLFTTFPTLFNDIYGWGPGVSGLAYLGPGIGFLSSTAIAAPLLSKIYSKLSERNGGKGKPEFRIPVASLGSIFVPIGLFWYGWSAQARIHWIMPIIGGGIFGFGMMLIFIPLQLYLVDVFTYAASALAAASVFRALFAFAFPLFGEQMFATLGSGGGNSLLAGMAIITGIPFPVFLYFKGEQMRMRNVLTR